MSEQSTAGYRILVTASRDWIDAGFMRAKLDDAAESRPAGTTLTVVHGNSGRGDWAAKRWALARHHGEEPHDADWGRWGRAAGPRRNSEMVAAGADRCLAFIRDGSRGASDCAEKAEAAGIPTTVYRWEDRDG